jgi:hypothetical protein
VEQGGFARSNRASYDGKTLALKDTLKKYLERSTMRIGQVQEPGVRRKAKRFFLQLVKGRVQTVPPVVPKNECRS